MSTAEDIEKLAGSALDVLVNVVGVDTILKLVFARTGSDRAKAMLEAEYKGADAAADADERTKFPAQ